MSEVYQQRPVRLVLGFSAGSASDMLARLLAPELSRHLGQPVTIELHPGDNGATGARLVAGSEPDGHTLFVATLGTHALAPNLARRLPYDPVKDFAPVTLVAQAPLVLAVHPSLQAESVKQLIDLARSMPGRLGFASSAYGGAPHLAAALFQDMAGIEMAHVCYERTQELYGDLIAGRVALSFNNVMSMLPCLAQGQLRGLAVTGSSRCAAVPGLSTVSESGLPGYEVTNWLGIVAPAKTPRGIVAAIHHAVIEAMQSSRVVAHFTEHGVEPRASPPDEFAAFMRQELARWAPIVAKLGRKLASENRGDVTATAGSARDERRI
jgi:tripartite-type tricarboxylate transporter receptor subunit TctC